MPGKDTALAEQEVRRRLAALPGWEYRDAALRRTYQTDGWRGSMLVTNAIAFICEAADHHPHLAVTATSVRGALSPHHPGGITAKDFEVAALIEAQVTWKPPAGSSLSGPGKPLVRE